MRPRARELPELERELEELTRLVMTLQERLDRNPGSSNKPPSSDSPAERAERQGKGEREGPLGLKPRMGAVRAGEQLRPALPARVRELPGGVAEDMGLPVLQRQDMGASRGDSPIVFRSALVQPHRSTAQLIEA